MSFWLVVVGDWTAQRRRISIIFGRNWTSICSKALLVNLLVENVILWLFKVEMRRMGHFGGQIQIFLPRQKWTLIFIWICKSTFCFRGRHWTPLQNLVRNEGLPLKAQTHLNSLEKFPRNASSWEKGSPMHATRLEAGWFIQRLLQHQVFERFALDLSQISFFLFEASFGVWVILATKLRCSVL